MVVLWKKQGKYEIIVVYEDEANLTYVYGLDADNKVIVIVYDEQNVEIKNGERLKKYSEFTK